MSESINWKESSSFTSAEESPGFLLWRTQLIWRRKIENVLRPLEITHPQFVILTSLAYLNQSGKLISQVELATHSSYDITTTSQILRLLEKRGLITRTMQSGNEKTKCPQITATGIKIFQAAINTVETADTEFFAKLPEEEIRQLNRMLVRLSSFN